MFLRFRRVEELELLVQRMARETALDIGSLTARVEEKGNQVTTLKAENDRLRVRGLA